MLKVSQEALIRQFWVYNWLEFDIDGISSETESYDLGGTVKYHFMTESTTVPYVGGQIAVSLMSSDDYDETGMMYGPLVGAKFFMNESTSLFIEYQYRIYGGDVGDIFEDGHALIGGISWKF